MVGVVELIEAAEGLPRMAGRSALYRWLMLNREEFSRQLVGGRPDWSALATAFGRFGLLDRNRHLPTGQTARMTWWRVRQDAAKLHSAGVPAADALSITPQPEHLVDKRTKRRVKAAAKKLRPNTAAKRAEPRQPAQGVTMIDQKADDERVNQQLDNLMRDLAKGSEHFRPQIRRRLHEPL